MNVEIDISKNLIIYGLGEENANKWVKVTYYYKLDSESALKIYAPRTEEGFLLVDDLSVNQPEVKWKPKKWWMFWK